MRSNFRCSYDRTSLFTQNQDNGFTVQTLGGQQPMPTELSTPVLLLRAMVTVELYCCCNTTGCAHFAISTSFVLVTGLQKITQKITTCNISMKAHRSRILSTYHTLQNNPPTPRVHANVLPPLPALGLFSFNIPSRV